MFGKKTISFHSRRALSNKETNHIYNTSLCQALHLHIVKTAVWKNKDINWLMIET